MILVVLGTRPELVKMAPVVTLARERGLPVHVHCTMQSPDLVDRQILAWDSKDGDLNPMGREIGLRDILAAIKASASMRTPSRDILVVQGDTRTAFESAVLGYERGWPVFHVEAGVRTYDLSSPWPEEGYRQMISRIATWQACTTKNSAKNLRREGKWEKRWVLDAIGGQQKKFMPSTIRITGSPVVESVRARAATVTPSDHLLVTLHRRENQPHFTAILQGIAESTDRHVLWPSHPNHWATDANRTNITPIPPMDPWRFARALASAAVVVTDSGGVQEEANALGVPCVVARTVTDRPESLGAGGAVLGGVTVESVSAAIREALTIDRTTIDTAIYGDGEASRRIVEWWVELLEAR